MQKHIFTQTLHNLVLYYTGQIMSGFVFQSVYYNKSMTLQKELFI